MEKWKFSDNKEESDLLFSLVKKGIKTATSSLYNPNNREQVPEVGELSIITNNDETQSIIIKYTNIEIIPFSKITKEFAKKEGEGDLSLEYWQNTHRVFFSKRLQISTKNFDNQALILCEEFKITSLQNRP